MNTSVVTMSLMLSFVGPSLIALAAMVLAVATGQELDGSLGVVQSALLSRMADVRTAKLATWISVTKEVLSYVGLVLKGEFNLRLASLLASSCSYTTQWMKWPSVNWVVIVMQSGLLLRAGRLTWRVYLKTRERLVFSERELKLYHAHFEELGLTQREYYELLRAGAEWRRWPDAQGDAGADGARGELTTEGRPVESFVLLTAGQCTVSKGGDVITTLTKGMLVGESSFARRVAVASERSEVCASASVVADGEITYVAWPIRTLAQHMAKSTQVKACLMTLIAAVQADKLEKTSQEVSRRASSPRAQ